MSRFYYYLSASLPVLSFDAEPPRTCEEFLDDCRRIMTESDYLTVKTALDGTGDPRASGNEMLIKWNEFDHTLRNQMAAARATQAGKDPADHVRGGSSSNPVITELLNQASKNTDLLKSERLIDEARWKYLDELSAWHLLDLDFLIVYGLKLKILERYQPIFHSSAGKEKLESYKELKIEV